MRHGRLSTNAALATYPRHWSSGSCTAVQVSPTSSPGAATSCRFDGHNALCISHAANHGPLDTDPPFGTAGFEVDARQWARWLAPRTGTNRLVSGGCEAPSLGKRRLLCGATRRDQLRAHACHSGRGRLIHPSGSQSSPGAPSRPSSVLHYTHSSVIICGSQRVVCLPRGPL